MEGGGQCQTNPSRVPTQPGRRVPRLGLQTRLEQRFFAKPPTPLVAASTIAGVSLAISIIAGAVAHWIDDGIPSVWLGIYWAVQTVTTVGYGDPTPSGTSGQVIAILLMLVGTAFIAVITAAVTSIFIERARALRERKTTAEDPTPAALEDIRARLERIEASLRASNS